MKARKIGLLSLIFDEFEDDDDDIVAIAAMQQTSNSIAALCLKRKDRQRHFRLGHLSVNLNDWIQRYLDADFHDRFR